MIIMSKFVNVFSKNLCNLSHAEKYVFYYIDSNLEKAMSQSLTKMAEENNVSTTTIIRMCNKLGVSGFSELKYILKNISKESSTSSMTDYLTTVKKSLNLSIDNLDLSSVKDLATEIKKANKIIIVAVGLSKPMGEYFSKLLMQANKSTLYIYESHIINLLDKSDLGDLIIFISNSGETSTLVTVAEKLSYSNLKTAAIINSPNSSLSNLVNFSINTYTDKTSILGYDITPRSTLMIVIDLIFACYVQEIN